MPRRRVPRRSSSPRGRGVEPPVAQVTVTSARNERCARKGVEGAGHSDHHQDGSQHERERIIGRLRKRQGRWRRHGVRARVRKKHFVLCALFLSVVPNGTNQDENALQLGGRSVLHYTRFRVDYARVKRQGVLAYAISAPMTPYGCIADDEQCGEGTIIALPFFVFFMDL